LARTSLDAKLRTNPFVREEIQHAGKLIAIGTDPALSRRRTRLGRLAALASGIAPKARLKDILGGRAIKLAGWLPN
jgi:hypothetical protein